MSCPGGSAIFSQIIVWFNSSTLVDDDTSTDAGEARKPSKKVKKPGFLKRLFPCLKNRSGRVAPLEKGD